MNRSKTVRSMSSLAPILFGVWAASLLIAPSWASAVDSGPTVTGDVCMQKLFGFPVKNSNRLNCTANDIRLARAISVSPATCIEGTTFDLTGTFEVNVTASQRYDAGFYFNIAGGSNARLGTCSLSTLDRTIPPAENLDGDVCGDLRSAGTINVTFTVPGVLCSDSDGDGFLNLPNCTAWHSNSATVCNQATDATPETKSKCVCDDSFQVPVRVEPVTGAVTKTATQALVTYSVNVKNNSATRTVTIESIDDDHYGDITDSNNGAIESTTCNALIGQTLAAGGGNQTCAFTALYENPGTAGPLKNIVTAVLKASNAPAGTTCPDATNCVSVTGNTTIDVDLAVGVP